MDKRQCWQCAEIINAQALACPQCLAKQRKLMKHPSDVHPWKWAPLVAIVMVLVIFILAIDAVRNPEIQPAEIAKPAVNPASPYGDCVAMARAWKFESAIKGRLRNPASFEHVESRIGPVDDGAFAVIMTYRATNGYGAVDTAIAMGEVRLRDCAVKVTSI